LPLSKRGYVKGFWSSGERRSQGVDRRKSAHLSTRKDKSRDERSSIKGEIGRGRYARGSSVSCLQKKLNLLTISREKEAQGRSGEDKKKKKIDD